MTASTPGRRVPDVLHLARAVTGPGPVRRQARTALGDDVRVTMRTYADVGPGAAPVQADLVWLDRPGRADLSTVRALLPGATTFVVLRASAPADEVVAMVDEGADLVVKDLAEDLVTASLGAVARRVRRRRTTAAVAGDAPSGTAPP